MSPDHQQARYDPSKKLARNQARSRRRLCVLWKDNQIRLERFRQSRATFPVYELPLSVQLVRTERRRFLERMVCAESLTSSQYGGAALKLGRAARMYSRK